MGTRSLTVMLDEDNVEIAVLYRQYDGYPTGHGQELKDFLAPFVVVNGIGTSTACQKLANGAGCLAAQLVSHFKGAEPGGFYLYPAGTRDAGEEFIYTVRPVAGVIRITVQAGAVTYFGLPGTEQANMPVIFDGTVEEFKPEEVQETTKAWPYPIPNDFLAKAKKKKRSRAKEAK